MIDKMEATVDNKQFMCPLVCANDFFDWCYRSVEKIVNRIGEIKWMQYICSNGKCRKTRNDCVLMKCDKCRVARYCSRRCQKYDWIKNHKQLCHKLRTFRKVNHRYAFD